ncbi:uncharacterized protein LOC113522060 [Galleria mellonella]|uniref:Uncharacterized protein LOC113522060 n=1 Tax=Galleria mellonella TaxID=7137 RepID=A0ABM3N225_GALME|nr:uncharacterized protein LOC113522060 [Galleria mellonella]
MDRFVTREPRVGTEYPQGNQHVYYSGNPGESDIYPSELYYGGLYGSEFQNVQRVNPSFVRAAPYVNSTSFVPPNLTHLQGQGQGQVISGIDPRYLAPYSDGNANFIATGLMQQERSAMPINSPFGRDYQNRNLLAPERNKAKMFQPQMSKENLQRTEVPPNKDFAITETKTPRRDFQVQQTTPQTPTNASSKVENLGTSKHEHQIVLMSRSDKLKALYKSGTRVFSGPVEKILKWHKSLQDIGVLVLYEIVAKCVSVRAGELCAKNLVVRDENGPAMQVVYYEVDFLLPELKPPCTIRVIGRMMAGTSRFQAFNVRPATGDDVATLPRRTAVAVHHVAKLCKDYGTNV